MCVSLIPKLAHVSLLDLRMSPYTLLYSPIFPAMPALLALRPLATLSRAHGERGGEGGREGEREGEGRGGEAGGGRERGRERWSESARTHRGGAGGRPTMSSPESPPGTDRYMVAKYTPNTSPTTWCPHARAARTHPVVRAEGGRCSWQMARKPGGATRAAARQERHCTRAREPDTRQQTKDQQAGSAFNRTRQGVRFHVKVARRLLPLVHLAFPATPGLFLGRAPPGRRHGHSRHGHNSAIMTRGHDRGVQRRAADDWRWARACVNAALHSRRAPEVEISGRRVTETHRGRRALGAVTRASGLVWLLAPLACPPAVHSPLARGTHASPRACRL